MGFSAGAVVAVDLALHFALPGRFGGVVAVASSMLSEQIIGPERCCQTPILVTHGQNDDRVSLKTAQLHANRLRNRGVDVIFKVYSRKRHEFISSPEEARDVFQFFSSHLYLRNLGLENNPDIVPVTF